MKNKLLILFAIFLVSLSGCNYETEISSAKTTQSVSSSSLTYSTTASSSSVSNDIAVSQVTFNQTTLTLYVGETQTIIPSIYPTNATNKTLVWESTNSQVAFANNGSITAVDGGSAVITATASNGIKASCIVTVKIAITYAEISPKHLTISTGTSYTFKLSNVLPKNASEDVALKTDDTDLISINGYGKITGIHYGTAKVYFETKNGIRDEATIEIVGTLTYMNDVYADESSTGTFRYSGCYANVTNLTTELDNISSLLTIYQDIKCRVSCDVTKISCFSEGHENSPIIITVLYPLRTGQGIMYINTNELSVGETKHVTLEFEIFINTVNKNNLILIVRLTTNQ